VGCAGVSAEKRADRRQDLSWREKIVGLDGAMFGECTMFNVSASGAKLTLQGETSVPDQLLLLLAQDGSVQRQCEVK